MRDTRNSVSSRESRKLADSPSIQYIYTFSERMQQIDAVNQTMSESGTL
jgi:hypothetical protein